MILGGIFPAGAHSAPAGPKIVLVPPRSMFLYNYICLSALEDHHAVYTRCIGRMHSLATTSGPARKWVWFQYSKWRISNRFCLIFLAARYDRIT